MHLIAYLLILISMLFSLSMGVAACLQRWQGRSNALALMETGHVLQTGLMTVSSIILFWALATNNFSFVYVAEYTDVFLPMFYRLTAFWAGQAGSLLFWAWMAAIFGAIFVYTPGYKSLSDSTKIFYWLFFFTVMAFFLFLITCWNNPFTQILPPPADGNGLNPLLQHPGMIFHPPLLFMGYAGFSVPACLALAQSMTLAMDNKASLSEGSWVDITRNFTLTSWLFLTAGIILGAWWSYMELGWGGYWAWDPVENASLIPWFSGTALLHTCVLESKRGVCKKTNVFLMALTLIMSFFATYLVRSGVVDSLHAFGDNSVGQPLLIFIIASTVISLLVVFAGHGHRKPERTLSDIVSREGFLIMATWLLLALGLVILLATMWPVFSQFWSKNPVGLEAAFYNRVCLPFFSVLVILLMICPWLKWKGGLKNTKVAMGLIIVFILASGGLWALGMRLPLALLSAGASITCAVGIIILFFVDAPTRKLRPAWGAYGVHFGLALVALGVAFSGPYQDDVEVLLKPGGKAQLQNYEFTYVDMSQANTKAMAFVEAEITVTKDGESIGSLHPQRRIYRKFKNPFAEASVLTLYGIFGDELYATLLGSQEDKTATLKLSVHPLVNWIWIGGTLMSLFPFLGLTRYRRKK